MHDWNEALLSVQAWMKALCLSVPSVAIGTVHQLADHSRHRDKLGHNADIHVLFCWWGGEQAGQATRGMTLMQWFVAGR